METLIATLGAIAVAISIPIMILNLAGGIVAGIWLIIVGQWVLVVSAILSTIVATFILSLLMMPMLILMKPVAWAAKRKNTFLMLIFGAIASAWTYVLMLFYGVGSFIFVLGYYQGGVILPYLLLAYCVSTAPWTYMASGEIRSGDEGAGTVIPGNGICVASIAMMIAVVIYGSSNITALAVACLIPLILAWILQMAVIFFTTKDASKVSPE